MTHTTWSTDNIHVFDSAGRKVAKLERDSEDGAVIVTAVNSHDALLEALCETQRVIRAAIRAGDWVVNEDRSPDQAFVKSVAAIKAAKP